MSTNSDLSKLLQDLPRVPEWKAMEQRAEKASDQAGKKMAELVARAEKYPALGAMPSSLQGELIAQITLAATIGLIVAGKEATMGAFEEAIAKAKAAGAQETDPFLQARDAQLEASFARYEIESHLNSLSQGGLEQMAQALRDGGRLRVMARR